MTQLAMLGTQGSHDGDYIGEVTSATSNISTPANDLAIIGDGYYCPLHGQNSLASNGSSQLNSMGAPVGKNGTVAECGAVLYANFAPIWDVAD